MTRSRVLETQRERETKAQFNHAGVENMKLIVVRNMMQDSAAPRAASLVETKRPSERRSMRISKMQERRERMDWHHIVKPTQRRLLLTSRTIPFTS